MQFCIFVINIASRDTRTDWKDIPDSSMIPDGFSRTVTSWLTASDCDNNRGDTTTEVPFGLEMDCIIPNPIETLISAFCHMICHRKCNRKCDYWIYLIKCDDWTQTSPFLSSLILKLISVQKTGRRNCCEGKSEIKSKGR